MRTYWIMAVVLAAIMGLLANRRLGPFRPLSQPPHAEGTGSNKEAVAKRSTAPEQTAPALPGDVPGLVSALNAEADPRGIPLHAGEKLGLPNARLEAVMDALTASRSPELPEALLAVVRTGSDRSAVWACEVLARRADSDAAPVFWQRLTSPGCPKQLARQIHRAFGRLDRKAAALFLIAMAEDADWQNRQLAIQLLVSAPHPAAIPVLMKALGDSVTAVRGSANEALARIGPEAAPALLQAAAQPRAQGAAAALESLALMGDPAGMRLLAATLASTDPFAQMNARSAFEKALRPNNNRPRQLEDVTADGFPEGHLETIREAAFDALSMELQTRQESKTRRRLVETMGLTGTWAVPLLRRLAETDADAAVRGAANRQLGTAAGRDALPTLLQTLQSGAANTREGSVTALMPLIGDSDLSHLMPVLNHADAGVRSCALRLMRQMRGPEARRLLLEHITATDSGEAGDALYSLGRFPRDPAEVPRLKEASVSPHRAIRYSVAELLGKHNLPETRAILIEMTAHVELETGQAAEIALGATDDPCAFWPLFDLAARRAKDGIQQGLSPALPLQAKRAWASLLPLLDDPSPGRRAVAAAVLARIQEPTVKDELTRRILNWEREIILNAAEAFEDGSNKAVEDVLVEWMDSRVPGGPLASRFLNSSNARLSGAARSWFTRHGYQIILKNN